MTSVLLQMKYSTLWYMDIFSASSYTGVTYCQKWLEFSWLKLIGILGQYDFSKFMPIIFKYGDILNSTFTPDKELNISIYRSPSYLIIYRSHTLLKMVRFFGPPCIYFLKCILLSKNIFLTLKYGKTRCRTPLGELTTPPSPQIP